MEIFENIGKKATDTYKFATGKTGKVVEETKLKLFISRSKDEINDIYADIGKAVYEKYVEGEEVEEKYIQNCIEIDTIASEIENARMKILELNNKRQCQNCYAEIDKNYKYCPSCGYPKEESKNEKADQVAEEYPEKNKSQVCKCGAENSNEACFCTECGAKLISD